MSPAIDLPTLMEWRWFEVIKAFFPLAISDDVQSSDDPWYTLLK